MAGFIAQMLKFASPRKETAAQDRLDLAQLPKPSADTPPRTEPTPRTEPLRRPAETLRNETLRVVRKQHDEPDSRQRDAPPKPAALQLMRDLARVRGQLLDRDEEVNALRQAGDRLRDEIAVLRANAQTGNQRRRVGIQTKGPRAVQTASPERTPRVQNRNQDEVRALRADVAKAKEQLAEAQSRAVTAQQELTESLASLAREREAHGQTDRALEELRAAHADCGFALSAVESQIVTLRAAARRARKPDSIDTSE